MLTQRLDSSGRSILKLIGELDAAALPGVEAKLLDLAQSEDTTIDLSGATFTDLGSVRLLVACRQRARLSGHSVDVVNAPPHVEEMLGMLDPGRRGEGETYVPPPRTTTDDERSRADSEQIVRLQCAHCGHQTFRPESSTARTCENCGRELEAVAVFRDRRRVDRPVSTDRRRD